MPTFDKSPDLEEFQLRLGHTFADGDLLRQALTHASFGHEKRQRLPDNQRLEFQGDAVLQLAVTTELYHRFPKMTEPRPGSDALARFFPPPHRA